VVVSQRQTRLTAHHHLLVDATGDVDVLQCDSRYGLGPHPDEQGGQMRNDPVFADGDGARQSGVEAGGVAAAVVGAAVVPGPFHTASAQVAAQQPAKQIGPPGPRDGVGSPGAVEVLEAHIAEWAGSREDTHCARGFHRMITRVPRPTLCGSISTSVLDCLFHTW
jgi:hypothetical protein